MKIAAERRPGANSRGGNLSSWSGCHAYLTRTTYAYVAIYSFPSEEGSLSFGMIQRCPEAALSGMIRADSAGPTDSRGRTGAQGDPRHIIFGGMSVKTTLWAPITAA